MKLKGETVLVLRTVDKNRKAYGGFRVAQKRLRRGGHDWNAEAVCGQGLHGCLKGVGESSLLNWAESALWQVVEVERDQVVELDGKVKFPRGVVLYTGNRQTAANMIAKRYPDSGGVIGATITVGDGGTATAGYAGTATAGDRGTATAGDGGTATAGVGGTATAGVGGTATAGDPRHRDRGHDRSTATIAGDRGHRDRWRQRHRDRWIRRHRDRWRRRHRDRGLPRQQTAADRGTGDRGWTAAPRPRLTVALGDRGRGTGPRMRRGSFRCATGTRRKSDTKSRQATSARRGSKFPGRSTASTKRKFVEMPS